MKEIIGVILVLLLSNTLPAQQKLVFDGQLSVFGNYAPQNDLDLLFGGRYIPELSYGIPLDSTNTLDFLASGNLFGNIAFHAFDSSATSGNIRPYRIWARMTGHQYEIRVGLQKIDFGVATVLRPLQWFNQVDPRDPLGITNGVYGALGRYYFLNNANIWFWVLYGNGDPKGFEIVHTNKHIPEIGGRFQHPIPKGEIGLTYHHRTADSREISELPPYEKIPENRFGLDVKWDILIGAIGSVIGTLIGLIFTFYLQYKGFDISQYIENDTIAYGEGDEKSFTEYLAPAREKGTKMLKLEDRLWIYSPSTDRTIQLSGHMLRQSVMGSDLSYEDMMEDRKLTDIYNAKVVLEEEIDGRKVWVLELNAKVDDATYESRKSWIDQERYIPLKEELYAKSGQLLKRVTMRNVTLMDGRWYPQKFNYKDMLKDGKGTDFIVDQIDFNVDIPAHIFSKASLKK